MRENCTICLDSIDNQNDLFVLECCHYYHSECFLNYMVYNLKKIKESRLIECPLCRGSMDVLYVMNYLIDKIYEYKKEIKTLNKENQKLQNSILLLSVKKYFNFKRCFVTLKKNKNEEYLKEEEIMFKIEEHNCQIYNKNYQLNKLKKIYNNVISYQNISF